MRSVCLFDISEIEYNIRSYLERFASDDLETHLKYFIDKSVEVTAMLGNVVAITDVLSYATEHGYIVSEIQNLIEDQATILKVNYFTPNNIAFNLSHRRHVRYTVYPDNTLLLIFDDFNTPPDPYETTRNELIQARDDGEYIPERLLRQYGL